MDKVANDLFPAALAAIQAETEALSFNMASEPQTGALLRALAASTPAGTLLELGTGTGLSAAWLLEGMDAQRPTDQRRHGRCRPGRCPAPSGP